MAGSAEAIASIRGFVEEHGRPYTLDEVLVLEPGEEGSKFAGVGFEAEEPVEVSGINERLVPGGVVVGVFACRAVLIDPRASDSFLHAESDVEGLTLLRARLTYPQPVSELSKGGEVRHTATYRLRAADGERIDRYFADQATYSDELGRHYDELDNRFGGSWRLGDGKFVHPRPDEAPEMPHLLTAYQVESPLTSRHSGDDPDDARLMRRTFVRFDLMATVVKAVQAAYPEATILSSTNTGRVVREELPLLAQWLTSQMGNEAPATS